MPYPLEAALSGVRLTPFSSDLPGDAPFDASNLDNGSTPCAFWYRRTFTAAPPAPAGRVYLRFEAVMSTAKVFLNGHLLGGHQGGYDDFSFEVSSLLKAGAEANVLEVGVVNDALFHGKQFVKKFWAPGGIAYSTSSGIWQSVWLERLASGIPTPLSPLFLGRFAPVLRRFSAVILCCPASWRQDGENGRKMAKNGRNLGEKRARNSGG